MNLDRFKPTTVYTIYIASTPEKVWQALTSAEFSTKYFLGNSVEVEPRIGGAFIVRTPDGAQHITGEVFDYEPPRKLTVSFNVNWPALIEKLGRTVVTYEIEPAGHAVKLTMSEAHDRPIEDDILSGGRQGWPAILSSLKSLLGNRRAAGGPDGPAGKDAGSAEAAGDQDALKSELTRCEKRQGNLVSTGI